MTLLKSAAFGAAALASAFFASATPAEARHGSSFGIYVGGPGYYRDYDYRYRCDDYWYRRNHPRRCGYYYDYDDYYDDYPSSYYYNDYYPGFGFSFSDGGRRHHRHHRHHHHHW